MQFQDFAATHEPVAGRWSTDAVFQLRQQSHDRAPSVPTWRSALPLNQGVWHPALVWQLASAQLLLGGHGPIRSE